MTAGSAARLERLLLGFWLLLLLPLAWLDAMSPTAAQLRARSAWSSWAVLGKDPGPASAFFLAYSWNRRTLHIVPIPESPARLKTSRRLSTSAIAPFSSPSGHEGKGEGVEGTNSKTLAALHAILPEGFPEPGPLHPIIRWPAGSGAAVDGGIDAWVLSWPRNLLFWLRFFRALPALHRESPELNLYDASILAREAFRLEPGRVRLDAMPAPGDVPLFLSRIEGESQPARFPLPITVYNASGEPGLALLATRLLRSQGLDVVDFGNATSSVPSTHLVDYSGSEGAELVARLLGCDDAGISDATDSSRPEQVTVVLGRDFRRCALLKSLLHKP